MASSSESAPALASLVTSLADHPKLFRIHVSRMAAGKGRAVLEGLGLDAPTIAACFTAHPLNEEGAVQDGLTRWSGGKGRQPPTWRVLIEAMEVAGFAQYFVQNLITALVSFNIDSVPAEAPPDALSQMVFDNPYYRVVFRKHVSRKSAGKGRALLEGLELFSEIIDACFRSHPRDEEGAVQAGLAIWSSGQGRQPPTWGVLISAMEYAQIGQQHMQNLEKELFADASLQMLESSRKKEREWQSAYQESLRKYGSVSVEVIRTIFIGPTESGKSTLKHLLVHNEPKAVDTSTDVMATPEVVTRRPVSEVTKQTDEDFSAEQYVVGESTSAWQLVDSDVMKKALHACIAHQEYKKKDTYPAKVEVERIGQHEGEKQMDDSRLPERVTTEEDQSDVALLDRQFSQLLKEIEAEGKHLESKEGEKGKRIQLTDAFFMHLLDTGGQPSFQDVLPLLLEVPCTYVQVFNAALSLDERVPNSYRSEDHTRVCLKEGGELGRDIMLRSFSSMQTMAHKRSKQLASFLQEGSSEPQLRIFAVGTHKDQLREEGRLGEATQHITAFLEGLEGKPYYHSIEWDSSAGRPFFLVNAMAGKDDRASVNSLRKYLSSEGSPLKLDVPVMWFICQEVTRRCTEKKFFRLQDLETFCRKHKFIDGENAASQFRALLQLFSLLGFYSFFNLEGVPDEGNFVCTDTGAFLKEVSKLLAVQFTDTTKSGPMKNFKKYGILANTPQLFKFLKMNPDIDRKWFLEVLQHLGIAARLHCEDQPEYLIPAALPQTSAVLHPQCSVEPLCFTYEMKEGSSLFYDMPRGVFCRLAVELIQNEWHILKDKCTRSLLKLREPQKQFDIFLEDCAGYISIIPQALVEFSSPKKLHDACKSLCHYVEQCLSESTMKVIGSKFSESAVLTTGFKCLCKKEKDVRHLAIPVKHGGFLECSSTKEPQEYTKRHHIWFSSVEDVELKHLPDPDGPDKRGIWVLEECTTTHNDSPLIDDSILSQRVHDRPDHIMLFRVHVSRKAAGKARAVLEGVGLDQPTINACETAHPLNDEEAVQDGLVRWCGGKGTQPPTWNVLIAAMNYAGIAQQDIKGLKTSLNQPAVTGAFATPQPPQPTRQPPQATPQPPQATPQPPQATPDQSCNTL